MEDAWGNLPQRSDQDAELFHQRRAAIDEFLSYISSRLSLDRAPHDPLPVALHHMLPALQQHLLDAPPTGADAVAIRALTTKLGLSRMARRHVIRCCWRQGCFDPILHPTARIDQVHPHAIAPLRPEPSEIFLKIQSLVYHVQATYHGTLEQGDPSPPRDLVSRQMRQELARALVREGICRNGGNASAVANVLLRKERKSLLGPLHTLRDRGLFDRLPHTAYIRPAFTELFRELLPIVEQAAASEQQAALLYDRHLCWSRAHALVVAQACAPPRTGTLRRILRRCWQEGHFDHPPASQVVTSDQRRPKLAVILAFFEAASSEPVTIELLRQAHLCHDAECARRVADALNPTQSDSALCRTEREMAFGMMKAVAQHGDVGLYYASDRPEAGLILALERFLHQRHVERDSARAAQLTQDVRVLVATFAAVLPQRPHLLSQLLFSPVQSAQRASSCAQLPEDVQQQTLAYLVTQGHAAPSQATDLLRVLLTGGLPALLAWRGGASPTEAGTTTDHARMDQLIDHHLAALSPDLRQEVMRLARCLYAAVAETQVAVSLQRVLGDQPFSAYRQRLKRRLPVGYGAVQHDRQMRAQQRRVARHAVPAMRTPRTGVRPSSRAAAAAQLLGAFARIADLDARDAANRLYQTWTYGGIGLLQRDCWAESLAPPLLSLLTYAKLIRIEGRLPFGQARSLVNRYAEHLGCAPLSAQVCRALLSCFPKPARWNSGESERIATVRKTAGVVMPGTPWLHRVWRICVFPLAVPVTATPDSPASAQCHLLLLIDLGSQLPLGCWVSATPPGLREVKLALFHAFWHPGALDWPLRGAPELLQVPEELLPTSIDRHDLHAALVWSMVDLQLVKLATQDQLLHQLDTAAKIVEDLIYGGLEELRLSMRQQPQTVKAVQDAVVAWLRQSPVCYGHHRSGQYVASVRRGYAAPGYDTPAAGLLLPSVGVAKTIRGGVLVDGVRYTAPGIVWEPGLPIPYRRFPYPYLDPTSQSGSEEAIFAGVEPQLVFLTRTNA